MLNMVHPLNAELSEQKAEATPFFPVQPQTLEETGLNTVVLEDLILKHLLAKGVQSGRDLSEAMAVPFKLLTPILADMKNRMLLTHRTTAVLGDFMYSLSEAGRDAGCQAREYSAYCDTAPVLYSFYVESVQAQSIRKEHPTPEDLKAAYADIVVSDTTLNTIGPAISSGRGLFLFGEPGNGKTVLAERITNCFKQDIFIPRALWVEGEIVQLYDPQTHELSENQETERYDTRWVKIKRPTVIVGGELTMESLEIRYNPILKVSEAPLQMKANGGTFLIDDFGRQRIDHRELLNRWIIPLEKQYDYQTLANGKKIQVPFDQLIIFSTNLNPADLVDDAFLRRIPYKVNIHNPSQVEFRRLFMFQCAKTGIPFDEDWLTYLIEVHYADKRDFRACHPRDILDQISNMAKYQEITPVMTRETLDQACKNYFAAMGCKSAEIS